MTSAQKRQLSTLNYFLPVPEGRGKGASARNFMSLVIDSNGLPDFPKVFGCEVDKSVREFYKALGVISWTLKNGKTKYSVDLPRVKALVKERIDRGIADQEEYILYSIHSPDYGCYCLPLKKIFPEYKSVMRAFWRTAWLEGYQAGEVRANELASRSVA